MTRPTAASHWLGLLPALVISAVLVGGCSTAGTAGPTPAATGITRDQAIAIARAAVPPYANYEVLSAEAWPFGDVVSPSQADNMSSPPPRDRVVWVVKLGEPTGGQDDEVVVDSVDGRVLVRSHRTS